MKILVVGGTGFIGTALCAELAARDHEVTALSRSPDRSDLPETVDLVTGDVTDYDSIEAAFEGQDVAINLVALSPLFKTKGDRTHDNVHLGGTEHVVRAAETHGVRKLVQLSALGADPDGPTAYIRAKGAAEDVVRESELAWTIFRPSVVFGEGGEFVSFTKRTKELFAPLVPIAPLPGGGKTRFQPIHVEDFVPMIADAATEDRHDGETYEIGGPEVLTLREVTKLAYRAEGKSMSVVPVPMVLAAVGMSVMQVVPPLPFGKDQYRSLKFDNSVDENGIEAFGVDPDELTTLAEYLGLA